MRQAIGAITIHAKLLIAAERLQYEGYLRRGESNATVLALSKSGITIKRIVRTTRSATNATMSSGPQACSINCR
ncbi:hypothetical protein ACVWXL_002343 [Bradyrhizobium sp. GM22.5]